MSSVRKVDIADATEPLARYAKSAEDGPVVVTSNGQPIAVVVGVENADLETVVMSNHPKFIELIERSRTRQEEEGGIPSSDVRRLFENE
jgi:prevent-host-death family protein